MCVCGKVAQDERCDTSLFSSLYLYPVSFPAELYGPYLIHLNADTLETCFQVCPMLQQHHLQLKLLIAMAEMFKGKVHSKMKSQTSVDALDVSVEEFSQTAVVHGKLLGKKNTGKRGHQLDMQVNAIHLKKVPICFGCSGECCNKPPIRVWVARLNN